MHNGASLGMWVCAWRISRGTSREDPLQEIISPGENVRCFMHQCSAVKNEGAEIRDR